MADEKFHNDADKTVYKFHNPDNADHYEEPAEDVKRDEKAEPKSSTTTTTTKTSSTKASTAAKEK